MQQLAKATARDKTEEEEEEVLLLLLRLLHPPRRAGMTVALRWCGRVGDKPLIGVKRMCGAISSRALGYNHAFLSLIVLIR